MPVGLARCVARNWHGKGYARGQALRQECGRHLGRNTFEVAELTMQKDLGFSLWLGEPCAVPLAVRSRSIYCEEPATGSDFKQPDPAWLRPGFTLLLTPQRGHNEVDNSIRKHPYVLLLLP